jgi:site-specific recombinase XerD
LISSGGDLAVVGNLLSHQQAQTTMRYAHLRPDVVQAAAAESGKLFEPKKKTMVRLTKK